MKGGKLAALAAWVWLGIATATATEIQVPVAAFATSNSMHSPQLSPDGKHLAVSAELGEGRYALRIYRLSDFTLTALLNLPRFELPAQVRWVSDRRLIIAKGRKYGSREAPIPTGDIIATDADGKNQDYIFGYQRSLRLTGMDPGFGAIEGLPAQRNGHFYMRRLSMNARRSQLYDVDTEKGTARRVADIPVRDLSFTLDHNGVPRYAHGTDDHDNYLLYLADAQGGNWQPVPADRMGGEFLPLSITPDGRQAYALLSVDGGPAMLVKSDLDGGNRQVLVRDEFASLLDIEWTPRPSQPFAAVVGAGIPQTVYLDPDSQEAQFHRALSESFPGQLVSYINHSGDGDKSLVYVYSDRNPGVWYLFERADRRVTSLLLSREGLQAEQMGERRAIRFKASDGLELAGFLTVPAGIQDSRNLPMVLLPHGGPHGISDDWTFDTDAQFLASRGYLVLQVNFRGSGGRGYRFEHAGYRHWGSRMQDDLIDGVRWTIGQGLADASRICVYGASFGAYSAMMTAAKAPELFKCAAGASGVYDLKMMLSKGDIGDTRWGRNYLDRVIGSDPGVLRANSPVTLAPRIRIPVLLAHGELDERTPFAQARAMKSALENAGNAPEWMAVPKEGHGFYSDANNIAFYQRLEAFLGRHLGAAAP
jgi:dipeptidyl aminopeptidase/acylaminoacyl peptidase